VFEDNFDFLSKFCIFNGNFYFFSKFCIFNGNFYFLSKFCIFNGNFCFWRNFYFWRNLDFCSNFAKNCDVWRKCRFFLPNFDFWLTFWTNSQNFCDQNVDFWRSLVKMLIVDEIFTLRSLVKIQIFADNFEYWSKFVKFRNFDFWPKFRFVQNIEIFHQCPL